MAQILHKGKVYDVTKAQVRKFYEEMVVDDELTVTARELADTLGYSVHQIKRWTVAFYGPDLNTGQHSGKPRRYTYAQSMVLTALGILINTGFKIKKAVKALERCK